MRINRQKKVNKYLRFYINNFGFHKPYQVLIDGTFCFIALEVSRLFAIVPEAILVPPRAN